MKRTLLALAALSLVLLLWIDSLFTPRTGVITKSMLDSSIETACQDLRDVWNCNVSSVHNVTVGYPPYQGPSRLFTLAGLCYEKLGHGEAVRHIDNLTDSDNRACARLCGCSV